MPTTVSTCSGFSCSGIDINVSGFGAVSWGLLAITFNPQTNGVVYSNAPINGQTFGSPYSNITTGFTLNPPPGNYRFAVYSTTTVTTSGTGESVSYIGASDTIFSYDGSNWSHNYSPSPKSISWSQPGGRNTVAINDIVGYFNNCPDSFSNIYCSIAIMGGSSAIISDPFTFTPGSPITIGVSPGYTGDIVLNIVSGHNDVFATSTATFDNGLLVSYFPNDTINLSTRFISEIPTYNSVVATTSSSSLGLPVAQYPNDPNGVSLACSLQDCSNGLGLATTTLEWIGYINKNDFIASSTYLSVSVYPAGTGFVGQSTYRIPINNFGDFDISTTSGVIYGGGNKIDSSITRITPDVGWACLWGLFTCTVDRVQVTSTTTIFQVGGSALSQTDKTYLQLLGTTQGIINQVNNFSSTTATLLKACNPLSGFDVRQCISGLIIPEQPDIDASLKDLHDTVLTKAPFGWISRIATLISTTSTTTIPSISYTFQSDSPLSGDTLSFDLGNYLQQASVLSSQMTSNTDHKTVWQILQYPIDLFLYLYLAYVMLQDITGIDFLSRKKGNMEVDKTN